MRLMAHNVNPTGKTHSASVIFFHGSGDNGRNLIEWVRFLLGRDMEFPYIKVIYPTAPLQPYTPLGGQPSNVWFDRRSVTIDALESRKSMAKIYETAHELIGAEMGLGVAANRIIVGGFSMGGALAMHIGYHLNTDLAGVFACSSFINRDSIVYESLQSREKMDTLLPELRMFHGERDDLVPLEWGLESFRKLKAFGVNGEFTQLRNTMHELKKQELQELQEWIGKKLPPLKSDVQNKL